MVVISIQPKRGNHARYYPHSGYLGLSPVSVSGTVITKLEEDRRPVPASSLVVRLRCYEAIGHAHSLPARPEPVARSRPSTRIGAASAAGFGPASGAASPASRPDLDPSHPAHTLSPFQNPSPSPPPASSSSSVIHVLWQTEKTLWNASPSCNRGGTQDGHPISYEPLGDSVHPWKLVIPPQAVEDSQATHGVGTITYKTWRTWWSVEAVIYHQPLGIHGHKISKSLPLYLPNFSRSPSARRATNQIQGVTSGLTYSLAGPACLACGDEARLSISVHQSPDELRGSKSRHTVLKSASVCLVRTLTTEQGNLNSKDALNESKPRWKFRRINSSPPLSPLQSPPISPVANSPSPSNTPAALLVPRSRRSCRQSVLQTTILERDFSIEDYQSPASGSSPSALLCRSVTVHIPEPKSRFHYSIGETCQTRLATVGFAFLFKLVVKNKGEGLKTVYLSPLEVKLSSVSHRDLVDALHHLNPRPLTTSPAVEHEREPRRGVSAGAAEGYYLEAATTVGLSPVRRMSHSSPLSPPLTASSPSPKNVTTGRLSTTRKEIYVA